MKSYRKLISKLFLSSFLLFSLILNSLIVENKNEETQSFSIHQKEIITSGSRFTAAQPMLIAPYKDVDVFISKEQSPDFKFTTVGGTWNETTPSGTNVEVQVQFKVDGEWTEWIDLEEEEDHLAPGGHKKFSTASTNPAEAFKYKYLLYTDGTNTPIITDVDWTFIKTAKTISIEEAPQPKFSNSTVTQNSTYLALNSSNNNQNVVSRQQWGADESLRYLANNDEEADLIEVDADFYEQFKEELQLKRTIPEDQYGNKYVWPLEYPMEVKKFVVHHTATTNDLNDPEQAIRDIYYYHAVKRGWGDIGYNYIIDQQGRIYEGRAGGEGVVGAHAGTSNRGSIGIAVLGDYEQNVVPEKVISVLGKFIAEKAKIHGIDPKGKSVFRGQLSENILGHKDLMATTCPGVNLYSNLPVIRNLAAESQVSSKPKFINDYDYINHSETNYLDVTANETKQITIKLENIGKVDWQKDSFLVVDTNPEFENTITFPGSDPIVLASMQEDLVKPGQMATFSFSVKAGSQNKMVKMNIAPVINGSKKLKEYIVLPVSVQRKDFKYEFIDMIAPPIAMDKGETAEVIVKLKNTGNTTWNQSGTNTVLIGADHERDRTSDFVSPRSSRLATLEENQVPPGEIGTFIIDIIAPDKAGYYKEYFTPVVEGETWMIDSGMYFETTVYGGEYDSQVVTKSGSTDWVVGENYLVKVKLRNLGKQTWKKDQVVLYFIKEKDLDILSTTLLEDEVKPGEIGTIQFEARTSPDEELELKALMVRPKIGDNHLYRRPIYFYYNVVENKNQQLINDLQNGVYKNSPAPEEDPVLINKSQEDIRIKLGFSGSPKITANGGFSIYDNNEKIAGLSSLDSVEVKYVNGKYQVSTPGNTYIKSGPIRFIPSQNSILEVENYENRPTWNQQLNDNQYRGVLEVRNVDGELNVINELPIESYLKGLGEVSNSAHPEKIKSIIVAARTYAKYYMEVDEKFAGKPYHLNDDPNSSQKYIGYGFEQRAPKIAQAVNSTSGEVITYNGKLIKTPYFNESDGTSTKSALEVYGWTNTPYLKSVSDTLCKSSQNKFLGHGVGLSGCGATGMAESGYTYQQILKHYYTGVEIQK